MTQLIIYSRESSAPIMVVDNLRTGSRIEVPDYFEVKETEFIGFEISEYDRSIDYQIFTGDIPVPIQKKHYRERIEWDTTPCFDGASNFTPVIVRDASSGSILVQVYAFVTPSKLSESACGTMLNDIKNIGVDLLLELISKSRLSLSRETAQRSIGFQVVTPRVELNQIQQVWKKLFTALGSILAEPHVEACVYTAIRQLKLGEKFHPILFQHISKRGIANRRSTRSLGPIPLPTTILSRDTSENRIILEFIKLLIRRANHSLRFAKEEHRTLVDNSRSYVGRNKGIDKFFRLRDQPKIEKLQEIIEKSENLVEHMKRVIDRFALPDVYSEFQDFFRTFESPIMINHPQYSYVAHLMREYLKCTTVVIEYGDAEAAKSIGTIYEQWLFFQISATLKELGYSCISHRSIFEPIDRNRFSIDVDRNAAIDFKVSDGRIFRMRYEPTILPHEAARGIDSLYHGTSDSPWTPDLVIEILTSGAGSHEHNLSYAAVIDAKYSKTPNKYIKDIRKYHEIRSVETGHQIVRQVWAVGIVEPSIYPSDRSMTWSNKGEVHADPSNTITGHIGIDPNDYHKSRETLRAFVLGLLNHAEAYASTIPTSSLT